MHPHGELRGVGLRGARQIKLSVAVAPRVDLAGSNLSEREGGGGGGRERERGEREREREREREKGGVVKDNLLYNVNIPSGGKVAASLQTAEIVTLSYCLYNMYIPSKIHA